jgi:hypothetical protein
MMAKVKLVIGCAFLSLQNSGDVTRKRAKHDRVWGDVAGG